MKKKKNKRASVRRRAALLRGNMDVNAALIRCALACSLFIIAAGALSVSGIYGRLSAGAALLVEALLTLLCFGLPAVRGLFYVDGDQSDKLSRQALGAGQLWWLGALGVLLVCPATLLRDLIASPFARMGLSASGAAAAPAFGLFLPMLVKSALLVPVCEEVFFRGYFYAVLKETGVRGAALISALFFALVHGVDTAFASRFLMGLLLCALMLRTKSILATLLVHAAYNLTILLVSFAGLGGLFSGVGFVSCMIRVPLCAAFVYALKQVYTAKGAQETLRFGRALTRGEKLLLIAATAAFLFSPFFVAA